MQRRQIMRRNPLTVLLLSAALLLLPGAAAAASHGAGGVTGPAFYVDGTLYRTVVTPTDLSGTGAPAHSFDTIYAIDGQPNVATAAPGDRDYNGGRWMVHALEIDDYDGAVDAVDSNGSGDIDSSAEVDAAIHEGYAIDQGVVSRFECPVIKVPRGR
jgi:hypothetical protein